jgi:2-C-methyl-D-erythritol 4-phosphate cytidylyltransferase
MIHRVAEPLETELGIQNNSKIHGVLLSGGVGSRFSSTKPKQFLELDGKPLLAHSLEVFTSWKFFKSIVIVTHPSFITETEQIANDYLKETDRIVIGGDTRHLSTLNGIHALSLGTNDIVIIHDAARPFVTHNELDLVCHAATKYYLASTARKITDTLVDTRHSMTTAIISRENKYAIKTPQAFHTSVLPNLCSVKLTEHPTDLCSWGYAASMPTYMVEASPYNIKITEPDDCNLAKAFLTLVNTQGLS